jgi:AcrR family transcriptional regulator
MTKPGLRERKKQKTRGAIQREAMRLFTEQGYDATTVEQIADAAEISQSTFFRYFPTKEDVVLLDDYDPMMAEMILQRPAGEAAIPAVKAGMMAALKIAFADDEALIRDRIGFMLSVPAIRARMFEQSASTQGMLCQTLGTRTARDPASFEIRVAAAAILGALNVSVMQWTSEPGTELADLVARALDLVEAGFRL